MRKGTVIKKYNSAYYVLTPSGFLHEFKSKSYETDPDPAWSLDIKTCTIGAHSAPNTGKAKWTISGKTKGLMSSKHDFQFQATSYDDMLEWWTAIKKFAAASPNVDEYAADDSDSEPTSPVTPAQTSATAPTVGTIDERTATHNTEAAGTGLAHNAGHTATDVHPTEAANSTGALHPTGAVQATGASHQAAAVPESSVYAAPHLPATNAAAGTTHPGP